MSENKRYQVGDTVYVLARRSEGGCSSVAPQHPSAPSYPVCEAVVAQVDVCGVKGCYGLVWADNGEPVGIPFYSRSMSPNEDELLERVRKSQVPF